MAHIETRTEIRERPEIRHKITQCQHLMEKLGRHEARATEHKNAASENSETCRNIVNEESENLSGIYHEEKHMPYRDSLFANIESKDSGTATMLGTIRENINKLSSKISELYDELYEEYEVSYWVSDENDYAN